MNELERGGFAGQQDKLTDFFLSCHIFNFSQSWMSVPESVYVERGGGGGGSGNTSKLGANYIVPDGSPGFH